MPDILSIGLGGGSLVRCSHGGAISIGPDSVGSGLTERARVFGGGELTATDIAVASGKIRIGDPQAVADIDSHLVDRTLQIIYSGITEAADRMKTSAVEVPVILVGGGSFLAPQNIRGASRVVQPEYYPVANAIGAAIAQASGEVDKVYSYDRLGREGSIDLATREAQENAIKSGADPGSLKLVDVTELPLAYLTGGLVRLRIKVVGAHREVSPSIGLSFHE
jgi:N-methylhydantoinase A/oxoprolinase/acetone carboxylase beta subunit